MDFFARSFSFAGVEPPVLIAEAGVLADIDKDLGHAEGIGADDPRTRRRLDALQRRAKPVA